MTPTIDALLAPGHEAVADLVASWLGGRRPCTVAGYRSDLRAFAAWQGLEPLEALRELLALPATGAARLVVRWRAALRTDLAPATINRRLSALRAVVDLARVIGLVDWRLEIRGEKVVPYRETAGPGPAAIGRMLALLEPDATAGVPQALRDRAIVRLLADCALRVSEAVGLDVEHVDLEHGLALVLGKGRDAREPVALAAPTVAALRAWLAVRGASSGPLFIALDRATHGARLSRRSVAALVGQLAARAGARATPHGLRHTAITTALDELEGDVRTVQRFARHASPSTTTVYDDRRRELAGRAAAAVAARW